MTRTPRKTARARPALDDNRLAGAIAADLDPLGLPPERSRALRARILERVRKGHPDTPPSECLSVPNDRRGWVTLLPSVEIKILADEGEYKSFLLRMAAGSELPPHPHAGDEHSLVLEGSCYFGDVHFAHGDFHFAPKGSQHGALRTDGGCLLFVRGAYDFPLAA